MLKLAATRVFTGEVMLAGATLHIDAGVIAGISSGLEAEATVLDGLLAPGLVDVQVNGGGGVLFNDAPTTDTLSIMTQAHARLGVTSIMATLISDERSKIATAIDAVTRSVSDGMPGLLGLHLEGPWLSAPRRGVHAERFLRALDQEDLHLIAQKRPFPVMVTLSPEQASPQDVRRLVAAGVTVSIGHTAAPHEDIEALLSAGANGFTHLFNAMAPLEGRRPGAIGLALADRRAWAGLILDGIHVHPLSARAAFAAKGAMRLTLVSDAMATVGATNASMNLFGETVSLAGGALRTVSGTLAGAHLDLGLAARNAMKMLGVTDAEALRMAGLTPAEFLGVDTKYGRISPGAHANVVLFSDALDVKRVWVAGEEIL
ncbi:MAG: N-acetylglucosamine-6-phosphate deacetylase [Pseudomonadota bacterium]|jgi:N-acetylglucosamine-6-phosphate deacetylase